MITTVSLKQQETRITGVPEFVGICISIVCNSYKWVPQWRSTSVPAVCGTL